MVAGELAHLAREPDRAVGQQDLRLADPARIHQHLTRRREAGVVLVAEAEIELSERDPARLPAPSHVNDALLVRQQAAEFRASLRSGFVLEPRAEGIGPGGDGDQVQAALLKWAWAGCARRPGHVRDRNRRRPPWRKTPPSRNRSRRCTASRYRRRVIRARCSRSRTMARAVIAARAS